MNSWSLDRPFNTEGSAMYKINKELAKIFEEMAAYYRFKGSDNRFRVIAYQNAARVLGHLAEDVRDYTEDELVDISDIGEGIAAKIREYIETGSIEKYEELSKEVPHDFVELLEIQGIGPETLKTLHKELGVSSREQLLEALNSGKVQQLKGFGEKTVKNLLEGLKESQKAGERMLLAEALDIVEELETQLAKCQELQQFEFAGSLRRMKSTIGDIDILATAKPQKRETVLDYFVSMPGVTKVLAKGDTKASVIIETDNCQVDLRLVDEDQWGAALLYFTGSKDHNVHLRTIAKEKGWKINEYGIYDIKTDEKLAGKTEEEMYNKLGLDWIPPEMRENRGEIDLAANKTLPGLIKQADIRGDFHLHSDWSDGVNDIEELARHVHNNYDYEFIILTDHSKSSRIGGGLTEEELSEQKEVIQGVNQKLEIQFIKAGAEVDILADGTLDFDDDILATLDWVTASIHNLFNQDNTERILKACENPYVCAISHPTGRLIGKRKEYPVDLNRVIQKAKETGTALEINAQPQRMDLDDQWARQAQEEGVMLVIGTDSHDLMSFGYMKLGVGLARRAWCKPDHILNTLSWHEVEEFVQRKRKKAKALQ